MTAKRSLAKSKYALLVLPALLAIPFVALPIKASGKSLQKTVKISSEIQVGYDLGIPGDLLCQDGQYLYFKNRSACEVQKRNQENIDPSQESQNFDCRGPLTVTAINEIEEIFVPEAPELSILRFFSVDLSYTERVYLKESDGKLPPRFNLLLKKSKNVSHCSTRPKLPTTNIYSLREANKIQKYLILSLLSNGINVLNTPHGTLNTLANQHEGSSFGMTDLESSLLSSSSALTNSPAIQLQTPYCNPKLTEKIISELMGGESSGGGYRTFKTKKLQSLSSTLEIRSNFSKEEWSKILKKPLRMDVQAFELECLPYLPRIPNLAGGV